MTEHFKKMETDDQSDSSNDIQHGEVSNGKHREQPRVDKNPAEDHEENDPYADILRDIYVFTEEGNYPYLDEVETGEQTRGHWENAFQKIRSQEALLEQGLESKKSFSSILYGLADLASVKFPPDEPVGLETAAFAGRLIQRHLEKIENVIREGVDRDESEDFGDVGAALYAMSSLIDAGGAHFGELGELYYVGLDTLTDNFKSIENGIYADMDSDPWNPGGKLTNYALALKPLFQHSAGDQATGNRIAHITAQVINHQRKLFPAASSPISDMAKVLVNHLQYPNRGALDIEVPQGLFLDEVLRGYNVSPDDFHNAWQRSISDSSRTSFHIYVQRNLETMGEIDYRCRENTISYLNKNFGIYDFGRYPADMLIRQYNAEHTPEIASPYGLVINPRDDHNGVFYHLYGVYDKLNRSLEEQDQPWLMRVIEVDNKREMARRVVEFIKKYGPAKFGIIGGHGTTKTIRLGEGSGMYVLHADDLEGSGIQRGGKKLFEEGATIILNSCTTGAEEGIAEKMSETFGLTIIAPDRPTATTSIDIEIHGDKVRLSAKYRDRNSSRTYKEGTHIKND